MVARQIKFMELPTAREAAALEERGVKAVDMVIRGRVKDGLERESV